jgi:hypothetical protein
MIHLLQKCLPLIIEKVEIITDHLIFILGTEFSVNHREAMVGGRIWKESSSKIWLLIFCKSIDPPIKPKNFTKKCLPADTDCMVPQWI